MLRQVVLQPCADPEAQDNYQHTIRNFVIARDIEPYLAPAEKDAVAKLYPDGRLRVWGVKDGIDGTIHRLWNKIRSGDIVFFSWKSVLHSKATITLTFQSDALSELLWNDKAFHNIYLLDDLQSVDISYKMFNRAAGYKENNILRGFRVLDEKRSESILEFFPMIAKPSHPWRKSAGRNAPKRFEICGIRKLWTRLQSGRNERNRSFFAVFCLGKSVRKPVRFVGKNIRSSS